MAWKDALTPRVLAARASYARLAGMAGARSGAKATWAVSMSPADSWTCVGFLGSVGPGSAPLISGLIGCNASCVPQTIAHDGKP